MKNLIFALLLLATPALADEVKTQKVETPKVETKTEAQKVEVPKVDKKTEPLKTEVPKLEVQKNETKTEPQVSLIKKENALNSTIKTKVGFIDMQKLLSESEYAKYIRSQVMKKQRSIQNQVTSRGKQLEKQKMALEAELPTTAPEKRDAKIKAFQKRVEAYQKYVANVNQDISTYQATISKGFDEAIQKGSTQIGTDKSLGLIIARREVLFTSNNLVDMVDITSDMVKAVDQNKPKEVVTKKSTRKSKRR